MKIYLLSWDNEMVTAWERHFHNEQDVHVVKNEFARFMHEYDVKCVVSPANSFGLMDGGYDHAIIKHFGEKLKDAVQSYIISEYNGEQPVGTSFITTIPGISGKLIHTPTMRTPSRIKDPMVVYWCMRTCLLLAEKHDVNSIVIPAFGKGCGELDPEVIALMQKRAYDMVKEKPQKIDWSWVDGHTWWEEY